MADLLVGLDADTDVRLEIQSGDTWLILAPEEVVITVVTEPWDDLIIETSNEAAVALLQSALDAAVPIELRIYVNRIGEPRSYDVVELTEAAMPGRWTVELQQHVKVQPNPADPG